MTKNVKRVRRKNQRSSLPFLIGPIIATIAAAAVKAAAGAIGAKAAVVANAGAMSIGVAKASAMGGISADL